MLLVGGDKGIWIHADLGASDAVELNVDLQGIQFSTNKNGLVVEAGDSVAINIEARHLKIRDYNIVPTGALPPTKQSQERGLVFTATQGSASASPANINVDLINFRSNGSFHTMNPTDLEGSPLGNSMRLIEVIAQGQQPQFATIPPQSYPGQAIANVTLNLDGGNLFGAASDSPTLNSGWDVGIFTVAKKPTGALDRDNFYASVDVSLSGTIVSDMRKRGLYCVSEKSSRSVIDFSNGSLVENIGSQTALNPGVSMGSDGIELQVFDDDGGGYLEFSTSGNQNKISRCYTEPTT